MPGYDEEVEGGSEDSGVMPPNGPSREAVKKMDQILQVNVLRCGTGEDLTHI
jgi:hypothetical protein